MNCNTASSENLSSPVMAMSRSMMSMIGVIHWLCVKNLYSPDRRLGMFYFGHELRFSTIDHFSNIIDSLNVVNGSVIGASEKNL